MLRTSGTVLVRHWPALLTLTFAGIAARSFLTWVGVEASKVNATLGFFPLVLLPIATLTPLVLMMWVVRDSLPWLSAVKRARTDAARAGGLPHPPRASMLDYLGSVLIPFLPLYAEHGYLKSDVANFSYAILSDEVFASGKIFDGTANVGARLPLSFTTSMVVVFACAVVIRWALSKWRIARWLRFPGLLGAYVEVIWIFMLAMLAARKKNDGVTWLEDRRVVHGLTAGFSDVVDRLGPLSGLIHTVLSAASELVGSADTVIVVPVAWLTVGAVVYGFEFTSPTRLALNPLETEGGQSSIVPRLLRRIVAELSENFRERFGPLARGLRLLVRTGLRPMLLFCVAFVIVDSTSTWLWEVERPLIGPHNIIQFWMPLSDALSALNDGVAQTLTVVLLGAAVDRVLRAQEDGSLLASLTSAVPVAMYPAVAGSTGVPVPGAASVTATASVAAAAPVTANALAGPAAHAVARAAVTAAGADPAVPGAPVASAASTASGVPVAAGVPHASGVPIGLSAPPGSVAPLGSGATALQSVPLGAPPVVPGPQSVPSGSPPVVSAAQATQWAPQWAPPAQGVFPQGAAPPAQGAAPQAQGAGPPAQGAVASALGAAPQGTAAAPWSPQSQAAPASPAGAATVGSPVGGTAGPVGPDGSGDSPTMERPFVDPPFVDPPFVDPPFVDPPFVDPPFVDPPFVDPPFVDPPTVEQPHVAPPRQ
ncbi:hypothetical protein Raf01_19790 [Rugosimonospora africana]|uniref:Uncharacterized protein n=1 Tax=Rugosimonospora africana TaxID=556532 RepID=A0A8J3QQ95_9ACTN|nr:hypothetical protein Raf01_19790 [Rugosimonospora africana]